MEGDGLPRGLILANLHVDVERIETEEEWAAALLWGPVAGAVEAPKLGGSYCVAVYRRQELKPREAGNVSIVVAFAGNQSPCNSYEADNAGHEHSPTYNVGKDYKDNM